MKKILIVGLLVGSNFLFASPKGGVYPICNGQKWATMGTRGRALGKTCIHCRNGREVKLYVKLPSNGGFEYYTLNRRYVGASPLQAIKRICR
jgi:hypothetical protein